MKTVIYDETKWKLVPIEPTQVMLHALIVVEEVEDAKQDLINMWQAMLAACPDSLIYKATSSLYMLRREDARVNLWQAIQNIKIGNKTDDKLIVEELGKIGVFLCKEAIPTKVKSGPSKEVK